MKVNTVFCLSCAVDAWRTVRAASTLITAAQSSSALFVRPVSVHNTSNHTAACVRQVEHDGVSAIMRQMCCKNAISKQ